MQGKIIRGIAGFYYVYVAESGVYECKAKGIFRLQGIKPVAGDDAEIEVISEEEKTGNVVRILPRKNLLDRPPAANVDQMLVYLSMRTPDPNFLYLDRCLIAAKLRDIPCMICFNKTDQASPEEVRKIREAYCGCGCPVSFISVADGTGVGELKALLHGKTTVLAGPSGAGKSSFTNAVQSSVYMATGEISKKLSRGKNTTRHSELIPLDDVSYLCDTPGFTSLDTGGLEKEELKDYYPEFEPYEADCRFQGCAHMSEPDCGVKKAVAEGKISRIRYEQYSLLYEELREAEKRKYR